MPRDYENAYFEDEKGSPVPNDDLFKNKFKESTAKSLNFHEDLENYLDPDVRIQRQPLKIPQGFEKRKSRYDIYIGSKTLKKVKDAKAAGLPIPNVKVSLLFGVGQDLDNLGLRYYFEQVDDRILINVPGREPGQDGAKDRWNIGISGKIMPIKTGSGTGINQIKRLIDKAKSGIIVDDIPFKIVTLAAYSTGYGGLNQTVNEGLIPLDDIQTVVYYDCTYRADKPPPANDDVAAGKFLKPTEKNDAADELDLQHAGSAFNTRRAMTRISEANKGVKIIAYMATLAGSPRYKFGEIITTNYTVDFPTKSDFRNPSPGFPPINNLSFAEASLFTLTLTRCLKYALVDKQVKTDEIPKPFKDLVLETLPVRGKVASNKANLTNSPSGLPGQVMTIFDWGKAHEVSVRAATAPPGKILEAAVTLVSDRRLMYSNGWPHPTPKERNGILHAALLPEFGWEFLI